VPPVRHDWLEVRFHDRNRGFGTTFGELYSYSVCAYNAILPGDGQVAPSQVAVLADAMDGADLVLGLRRLRRDSLHRRVNSALFNFAVSAAAGRRVGDANSISLARTDLVRGLRLTSRSAFIHAEFLLECYRAGARVREVAIEHRARQHGVSAGARPAVVGSTVLDMGAYLLRRGPAWRRARTAPRQEPEPGSR